CLVRQAERSRQFVGDELVGYLSAVWWIVGVAGWGVGELDDGVIGLGLEVGPQPPNRLDIEDELVAVPVGVVAGVEAGGELDDGVMGLCLDVVQQPPSRLDIEDELVAVQGGVFDGFEEEGELGAGCPLLDPLGEHLSGASSSFPQHGPNVQGGWDKNAQT